MKKAATSFKPKAFGGRARPLKSTTSTTSVPDTVVTVSDSESEVQPDASMKSHSAVELIEEDVLINNTQTHTQSSPQRVLSPARSPLPTPAADEEQDDDVELVVSPTQYTRGKAMLGGSNAGLRSDTTSRLGYYGGDGPSDTCSGCGAVKGTHESYSRMLLDLQNKEEQFRKEAWKNVTAEVRAQEYKKAKKQAQREVAHGVVLAEQEVMRQEFEVSKGKWKIQARAEIEREFRADVEREMRLELRDVVAEEYRLEAKDQMRKEIESSLRKRTIKVVIDNHKTTLQRQILKGMLAKFHAEAGKDVRELLEMDLQQPPEDDTVETFEQFEKVVRTKIVGEVTQYIKEGLEKENEIEMAKWKEQTRAEIEKESKTKQNRAHEGQTGMIKARASKAKAPRASRGRNKQSSAIDDQDQSQESEQGNASGKRTVEAVVDVESPSRSVGNGWTL